MRLMRDLVGETLSGRYRLVARIAGMVQLSLTSWHLTFEWDDPLPTLHRFWRKFLRAPLGRVQRIARHLWRMCFAFFIATGSFFLGQQDVLPAAVRGSPVLFVLAFAPFAVMAFWLVRVRIGTRFRGPLQPSLEGGMA